LGNQEGQQKEGADGEGDDCFSTAREFVFSVADWDGGGQVLSTPRLTGQ